MTMDAYVTDEREGLGWRLLLGDSCERLAELDTASVDLSICSPPFASLYTYSPSPRDLGNSATRDEFLEHYGYVIAEQLRVTRPGRLACVHVQQLSTTKATHGVIAIRAPSGHLIGCLFGLTFILPPAEKISLLMPQFKVVSKSSDVPRRCRFDLGQLDLGPHATLTCARMPAN